MRVSIESGSLRVTTTRGFFLTDMSCSRKVVQTSLTRLFDTAVTAQCRGLLQVCFRFPWVPEPSLSGFRKGDFGLVLFPCLPPSLAEGRAKTRTSVRTPGHRKPRGRRGARHGGFWGGCFSSKNLS